MIDQALEQKPADFDALLKLLEGMGCEVSPPWEIVQPQSAWLGQCRPHE